jgi:hypothetical protein
MNADEGAVVTAPPEVNFVTFAPGTLARVAWYQGRPEDVTVLEDRTKWICDNRFPEKGFRYGSMYIDGHPNPYAKGETKRWIHFGLYNATGITVR